MERIKACLTFEDGKSFTGYSFTGQGETSGEVVFNTAMSGYQEVLTDPSYTGQIVAMTYPHIGNYGVNSQDVESERVHVRGFVVREYHAAPSNFRAEGSLADYLVDAGVLGITGVDTRSLTRHLRAKGAMRAVISTSDLDPASLKAKAQAAPPMEGRDLVSQVTSARAYVWTPDAQGGRPDFSAQALEAWAREEKAHKVAALDYGIKYNILRSLTREGCRVLVLPASTSAGDVLAYNPDGVFLSNGPGDPAAVTYAYENIARLLGQKPVFGICLGHQLIGLALGGRTFKLKFGHHGANQPVMDLATREVEITSQNHGFAVDIDSLEGQGVELTHINLNDRTLEGLADPKRGFFSVQYHPEAAPGPHDAFYLFKRFTALMAG